MVLGLCDKTFQQEQLARVAVDRSLCCPLSPWAEACGILDVSAVGYVGNAAASGIVSGRDRESVLAAYGRGLLERHEIRRLAPRGVPEVVVYAMRCQSLSKQCKSPNVT